MQAPFTYELPQEKIAQRPVHPYDSAKLMLVERASSGISEDVFTGLPKYLDERDLFVFNDTRVIPARLVGKLQGQEGYAELLLMTKRGVSQWECLGRPLKKFKDRRILEFSGPLRAKILERIGAQAVLVEFFCEPSGNLDQVMKQVALMPIPPYIRKGLGDSQDLQDYQTHFAKVEGSIAAPTASLHFTPQLISAIKQRGCCLQFVTLHLGTASFLPLWAEGNDLSSTPKPPAAERAFVSRRLIDNLREHKKNGGRVIAVGTSVMRLLESAARFSEAQLKLAESEGLETELFIQPGFEFKLVDALVTNFHQPRTSHLLLVEAFMGRSLLAAAYDHALSRQFRFLSYGDGMLIR